MIYLQWLQSIESSQKFTLSVVPNKVNNEVICRIAVNVSMNLKMPQNCSSSSLGYRGIQIFLKKSQ